MRAPRLAAPWIAIAWLAATADASPEVIAERAVVVDYKSLPFGASAMRAWYKRMLRLYGPVTGGGFAALERMEENYARLSDAELTRFASEYGASYAVLHARTPTARRVLYRNASYQVVQL